MLYILKRDVQSSKDITVKFTCSIRNKLAGLLPPFTPQIKLKIKRVSWEVKVVITKDTLCFQREKGMAEQTIYF